MKEELNTQTSTTAATTPQQQMASILSRYFERALSANGYTWTQDDQKEIQKAIVLLVDAIAQRDQLPLLIRKLSNDVYDLQDTFDMLFTKYGAQTTKLQRRNNIIRRTVALLDSIEFIPVPSGYHHDLVAKLLTDRCPFCGGTRSAGHNPGCPRQEALAATIQEEIYDSDLLDNDDEPAGSRY